MVTGVTEKTKLSVLATLVISLLGFADDTNPPVSEEKYIQGLCGWQRKQHLPTSLPTSHFQILHCHHHPCQGQESERQQRAWQLFNLPPALEAGAVLENNMCNNQEGLKEF